MRLTHTTLVRQVTKKPARAGDAGRASGEQKWQITRPPPQGGDSFEHDHRKLGPQDTG